MDGLILYCCFFLFFSRQQFDNMNFLDDNDKGFTTLIKLSKQGWKKYHCKEFTFLTIYFHRAINKSYYIKNDTLVYVNFHLALHSTLLCSLECVWYAVKKSNAISIDKICWCNMFKYNIIMRFTLRELKTKFYLNVFTKIAILYCELNDDIYQVKCLEEYV